MAWGCPRTRLWDPAPGRSCGPLSLPTRPQSQHVASSRRGGRPPRRLHSLYLFPPLPWPQLWDKRSSGRNHEADSTPHQPAPFTTPLGLQTVTLATNLSEASRALAGPGRGALSLEPPPSGLAPRARPRPPPPRRALPLVHVLGPPLHGPRLLPLPGLRLRLRGLSTS